MELSIPNPRGEAAAVIETLDESIKKDHGGFWEASIQRLAKIAKVSARAHALLPAPRRRAGACEGLLLRTRGNLLLHRPLMRLWIVARHRSVSRSRPARTCRCAVCPAASSLPKRPASALARQPRSRPPLPRAYAVAGVAAGPPGERGGAV